jgi:hypothetical protein
MIPVAAMTGAWLALLVAGGANAAWLFLALKRAGVRFTSDPVRTLDAEETGRVLAGILAQPAFLLVFGAGMVLGPIIAWFLLRQARHAGPDRSRLRCAAAALMVAAAAGAGQMVLARVIADRAIERTEALVSGESDRASEARSRLDTVHVWSERIYGGQTLLVAAGLILLAWPGGRGNSAESAA